MPPQSRENPNFFGHLKSGTVLQKFYNRNLQSSINDCNNSSLYYKTTILANLALAMSVNYDHKYDNKVHSNPLQ